MRKRFKKILVVLFTLLFLTAAGLPSAAQAADYYVATNGSDAPGTPGTLAAPFKTLEKGASTMKAGDTLYIRGGTYTRTNYLWQPPSGTSWDNATTIKAYNNEKVIVRPLPGYSVFQFKDGTHYVIMDGFTIDATGGNYGYAMGQHGSHMRIINGEVMNAPHSGIQVGTSDYNQFINLKVHDNGTPDAARVVGQRPASGHYAYGFYMPSNNNLIENCEIYRHSGFGIHGWDSYGGGVNNNTIINNKIHDNWLAGIGIFVGDGNFVANNVMWKNDFGVHVDLGAKNTKVYNNTNYDHRESGIFIGPRTSNTEVKNNIAFKNSSLHFAPGAILDYGKNTTLSNNFTDDPQFVNAAGNNFHLQSSSLAIDKGVTLASVPNDHDYGKRPFGSKYDIGAYEFGSTPGEAPGSATQTGGAGTGGDLGMKDQNCIPPSQPVNLGISVPAGAAGKVYVSPLVITAFSADSGAAEKYVFTLNAGAPMPGTEGMVWEVPISALGGLTVTPPVGFEGPLSIGVSIIPPFTP